MGRGIIESGLFRSQKYGVSELTSDPADHQEGERWIRTDLAPETDQIATYRFDMGADGVVDIPIYDAGATVDGVEKVRRVQVNGQTGFIPFTSSGATYPEWAFQHNGTRLGAHDALEASAIPDSGDLHARYDATELSLNDGNSVATWSDATGNGYDLTASGGPTYVSSGINGNPVVRFDGVDDSFRTTFATLPQPNHIFVVAKFRSTDSAENTIIDGDTARHTLGQGGQGDGWFLFAGGGIDDLVYTDPANTNNHIFNALFNTSNSEIRIDGTSSATGAIQGNGLEGMRVGERQDGGYFSDMDVGEILVYPQDKSSIQAGVESYLRDKWGITL